MNEMPRKLTSVEIKEVFELLPHRYPFLLIDKIVDIDGNDRATGIKNVTVNEDHFNGHFPGSPVMPGVLIIEAMAQTAGAICAKKYKEDGPKLVYFMTIDGAKFRKPVVPGDVLQLHVSKVKERKNIFVYECEGHVDGDKVAEAKISAMMIAPEDA